MKKRTNKPKLYRVVTITRWNDSMITEYTYTIPALSKAQARRCESILPGEVILSVKLMGS